MGDIRHYTSRVFPANQTIDLAQVCEPGVKVRKGAFQHLAVAGVLHRLELLEDSPAREVDGVFLLFPGCLLRRKSLF